MFTVFFITNRPHPRKVPLFFYFRAAAAQTELDLPDINILECRGAWRSV
jgi:hypothetical protein